MENKIKRNELGLMDQVEYKFNEDGYVDWRAMIPKEFIVVNKEYFKDLAPEEIEKLNVDEIEENKLLILLGGIKYLAKLRGFLALDTKVTFASDFKVICECRIDWIGNYETNGENVIFTGVGEATEVNTKGFAKMFLAAIAENRAFVRCVRNFLNVNIVGNDEIVGGYSLDNTQPAQNNKMAPSMSPTGLLEKALKEKNSSFAALKARVISQGGKDAEEAAKWETIKDIPERMAMTYVSKIRSQPAKRGRPAKTAK